MNDYPHREARDLEEATRRAVLYGLKVEASIILNLSVGPWSERARFHQIAGAAQECWKLGGPSMALFCFLYADICAGIPNLDSADAGSPTHMSYVWNGAYCS